MLQAGRPADALPPDYNAVHMAPLVAEYRLALGWTQASTGDFASAIAQYELALQQAPEDLRLLKSLASACHRVGLVAAAAQLYHRVLTSVGWGSLKQLE
jgi:Flp pilus assembly protein TadD